MADRTDDFQIPQLLPPTVNVNQNSNINSDNRHLRKKQHSKAMMLQPKSDNLNFNWDERTAYHDKAQPSIIDGKATAEESGYLGTVFSSAVINLVGNGFFLHETRLEGRKRAIQHPFEYPDQKISKQS